MQWNMDIRCPYGAIYCLFEEAKSGDRTMSDLRTLNEIAGWQYRGSQVKLPSLQRDFVWRSDQIENLWDSILRGYPIGSFVASRTDGGNLNLLDGQQRSTAILFGLNDPNSKRELVPFQSQHEGLKLPLMYLDLKRASTQSLMGDRKFVFRVVTQSHPWGYEKNRNRNTLRSEKRYSTIEDLKKKFPDKFKEVDPDSYFKAARAQGLGGCFPFDADLPVPFYAFLNSGSASEVTEKINVWGTKTFGKNYKFKIPDGLEKDYFSIEYILGLVRERTEGKNAYSVFINVLPKNIELHSSEENSANANASTGDDDLDEVENLFLRLNLGGTRPSNEEVNYSIIKTKITEETEREVERICGPYIDRAKFVLAAYFIFKKTGGTSLVSDERSGSIRVKPLILQKELGDEKAAQAFDEFLRRFILLLTKEKFPGIFFVSKENPLGISKLQWVEIANESPGVLILVLLRIWLGVDSSEEIKKFYSSYIGCIGLMHVYSESRRKQSFQDSIVREAWPLIQSAGKKFWSDKLISRIWHSWDQFGVFPVSEKMLKSWITKIKDARGSKKIEAILGDEFKIFRSISQNYFFLHHSQREYLASSILDDQLFLSEHNRPFDYDHIIPESWFRRRTNPCGTTIRDLSDFIGNKRVLPFSENRARGNASPKDTFLENPKSLIDSFCGESWGNVDETTKWKEIGDLLLDRFFQQYAEWLEKYHWRSLLNSKVSADSFEEFLQGVPLFRGKKFEKHGDNYFFEIEDYKDGSALYFFIFFDPDYSFTSTDAFKYGLWIRGRGKKVDIIAVEEKQSLLEEMIQRSKIADEKMFSDHGLYTLRKTTILFDDENSKDKISNELRNYLAAYGKKI